MHRNSKETYKCRGCNPGHLEHGSEKVKLQAMLSQEKLQDRSKLNIFCDNKLHICSKEITNLKDVTPALCSIIGFELDDPNSFLALQKHGKAQHSKASSSPNFPHPQACGHISISSVPRLQQLEGHGTDFYPLCKAVER